MRQSFENHFLFGNDGLVCLNLGADCVAEHEGGISEIDRHFGIRRKDETLFGLDRRKVNTFPTKCVKEFDFIHKGFNSKKRKSENVSVYGFMFSPHLSYSEMTAAEVPDRLGFYDSTKLWTGWSQDSFGIFSAIEKDQKRIKEIRDNLEKLNCAIWCGGGNVFQNAGLVIGLIDRMDKSVFKQWEKQDRDNLELKKVFKDTGIEAVLKNAGCEYFALSPIWEDKSKKTLKFWLNPMQQNIHNWGWFDIDELLLWAKGKGPVLKKNWNGKSPKP